MNLDRVRLIDLSVALQNDAAGELIPPKIDYIGHEAGAQAMLQIFGCKREDLVYSQGKGWAVENIAASSHTGTHIDAPYHYGRTSEGRPARRIDEVPLEWCFSPGVLFDMRHKAAGELITIADLQHALIEMSYVLKPRDIVLLHTGAAKRWQTKEYFDQPGLDRDGTLWLVEQGVRIIGIDAWTLDRSFSSIVEEFKSTGDGRIIWAAHFAGLTREYCQIEKLTNLDLIPNPYGFYVSCLPVKIKGASAGWCRAVALVEE